MELWRQLCLNTVDDDDDDDDDDDSVLGCPKINTQLALKWIDR